MKNFIDDLRTAARTFNLAQKARKQGAVLKVQEAINLPVSDFEGWGATMEATLLKGKANQAVCKVFNELSPKARPCSILEGAVKACTSACYVL